MAEDLPNPSLSTVTQPGTTSVEPPPDFKERIAETYDAITTYYDQWTLMHRSQRMNYTALVLRLLQTELSRNGATNGDTNGDTNGNTNGVAPPSELDAPSMDMLGLGMDMIPVLRGKHALDVGCGSGVPVLELLLAEEMETIGVDVSAGQLALARNHFPEATAAGQAVWAEKDMMELRYPPDEFHLVVGLYSLLHLPREEQTVFLHRAYMWLKPGGILMINFPKQELEGLVIEHWLDLRDAWMYWSSWGEDKTMQIINELGLEVLLQEETTDVRDGDFVWVIAKKS